VTIVVDARAPELAVAAARIGATVVVVDADAAHAGTVAGAVDAAGGRSAVFVGTPRRPEDRIALFELLDEVLAP
jgi:hypothetical protein